jgi:hypothetical protein
MRTLTAMASAALLLVAAGGSPAWAAPPALPEVPAGDRLVFTDHPDILDPHPVAVESWSPASAENAVAVNFTSGTPECSGVHATVHETDDSVTVDLKGGTLPEAFGRMCIMLAVFGTIEVPLQAPLGARHVFSAV